MNGIGIHKTTFRIVVIVVLALIIVVPGVAQMTEEYPGGRSTPAYIMFNPLGFLQFGPIVEGAYRISSETYIGAHLRFSGLGLAYHLINTEGEDEAVSPLSIGPAFTVVSLFPYTNNANRFYAGGIFGLDFGWSSGTDSVGDWEARWRSVVVAANLGHRWRYPSAFFLNVGLLIGGAFGIHDSWNYVDEPNNLRGDGAENTFFGMFELGLGWELDA